MIAHRCPTCGAEDAHVFRCISDVPVNSCLLFDDSSQAMGLQRGDIDLAFCNRCAFIFNAAWRPDATVYSDAYEETQVFSETYSAYQRQLAEELVDRYALFGKGIVEIGCGKGAFLNLICALGDNNGIGFDPSFVPERAAGDARTVFRREYFDEKTELAPPDFICCRMTLEHIAETQAFVRAVRRIASPDRGTIVFFQVPDVRRILAEGAFWDVYYEHCSYFSPASLGYLFRSAGFDVLRMESNYDAQYLTIEARPVTAALAIDPLQVSEEVGRLAEDVALYPERASGCVEYWRSMIESVSRSGGRVALWGSGSKAVAFLSAVAMADEIEYLVDINPFRWGKRVPGSAKLIVGPEHLTRFPPDLVIAMNPIYRREIAASLVENGCGSTVLCALGDWKVQPESARMVA